MNEYEKHPTWKRLIDQLNWYDNKSINCQKWYKIWKYAQLIIAAFIPVINIASDSCYTKWIVSICGASIAVIEGIQHLNQFSTLWITYRSTAEMLKHEKYLFLSGAGQYRNLDAEQKLLLLAERVEEHVSAEHANWFDESKKIIEKGKK